MSSVIKLSGYTENTNAREKGVRYVVDSGASFFIRRGGMASWHQARKDAADEVLGSSYNFDYIDQQTEEKILCKAVANYTVSDWQDLKDVNDNEVPYTLTNARNIFEAKGLVNYSLAVELLNASLEHERYLESVVSEDADYIKK